MTRLAWILFALAPALLTSAQDLTPRAVEVETGAIDGEDLWRRWSPSGRAVDLRTDLLNCGSLGRRCQDVYINGGHGQCLNGQCTTTCHDGFSWDPVAEYCRPTSRDTQNCGGIGRACALEGASRNLCARGQCFASACKRGYELKSGVCYEIDTTSNVNHCGGLYKPCVFWPAGATGSCVNSECVLTNCPNKYSIKNGACVADPVKQRARVQKAKQVKQTLCPKGETACPIADSASFEHAAVHHFKSPIDEYSGIMAGDGGYECLDVESSLESCGGCASTGEGQDCSRIPHVGGVGCEAGVCRIFSCRDGYKPNLSNTACIRAEGRRRKHHHASH